jgi:hypothetical protein
LCNGENLQRLIRISELASTPSKQGLLPVSPATIWRWTKEDSNFPKPIKIGKGVTAWYTADIESWLDTFSSKQESKK